VSALDDAYALVRDGSHDAFAEWVRLVESTVRASLRGFARVADVEAVLQETLLRMWRLAPVLELSGEHASLRYAVRIARNLALAEARRRGREVPLEDDGGVAVKIAIPPRPGRDLGLRRMILECLGKLPGKPGVALRARLADGGSSADRELAEGLRMTLNTFLQNVVRARRHLEECLKSRGVAVQELLR
jgi:DNA-directed RNA polymerase specialized sigma24 family protein